MTSKEIKEIILKKNAEITGGGYLPNKISVSAIINMLKEPFDAEQKSKDMEEKYFNNPKSEYYQKTAEQILEMWNTKAATSRAYGCRLDEYIQGTIENKDMELWKLDYNYDYDNRLNSICTGFDEFYKVLTENTDYEDIGGEIPLYYNVDGVWGNGRTDRLFYSPSKNDILVIDWKNTNDIKTKNAYGGKLKGPMLSFDDCNLNEYTFQVHFYKTALVNTYPELGLDENKIDVRVVQMIYGDNLDKHYNVYKENFEYNKTLIDQVVTFAYKRKKLTDGK